jgi:hypothetical protein
VEPRDYVDRAAALGRYTVDQLISFAKRLDPGLEDREARPLLYRLASQGLGVRQCELPPGAGR